jgi:hypothetical protein
MTFILAFMPPCNSQDADYFVTIDSAPAVPIAQA